MYTRKPIAAVLASLALVAANPLAVLNPRGSPSTDGHYVIEKVIIDSAYLLHLNDKEAPQQLPEKFQVWVNSKADTAGNAALCSTEWDANTAGGSMQVLNLPCSDTNIKATLQRYTVKPNFGWELIVKTPTPIFRV
ncbi:MAG: hypothetical protein M1833_006061 [Piccolia ochrophora]|nr:MAG: hypothetical protein M1833_006061 [Piccolia ochrophora]